MGISRKKAFENRRTIVETAKRLFRERGVDAVGVSELMRTAGFTHGGFYNHFVSKDALVAEVLCAAMENAAPYPKVPIEGSGERDADLAAEIGRYLSQTHRDDLAGCAVAALAGDVRRMNADAQRSFADGLGGVLDRMTGLEGRGDRSRAIARYCQMVGALVLSRSVVGIDRVLANEILSAVQADILDDIAERTP